MTTSKNESVVTSITPGAGPGRGRQPLLLKGGKPWAEARDEAKKAVSDAKAEVREREGILKAAQKNLDAWPKKIEKLNKAVTIAEGALAKSPKDATLKGNVKTAKQDVKDALSSQKNGTKAVDVAKKAVEKAKTAQQKAEAAQQKVLDSKPGNGAAKAA